MNKAWADLRRQGPDPLVAVALSAVWPGLGHFGHSNARALLLTNLTLAAAVAGVGHAATRSLGTLLTWSLTPSLLRALIADPERRPRVAVVAEAQGRLVGFAGLDAHPDRGPGGIADERTAIHLLGAVPRRDCRRRGIGRLLPRHALGRRDGPSPR